MACKCVNETTEHTFSHSEGKTVQTFNTSVKLLVGAALVASAGMASALPFVNNGGFELGTFEGFGGIGVAGVTGVGSLGRTTLINDWEVLNGKLIWLQNGYAGSTGALSTPYGTRFIDMTALTNNAAEYAKIEQVLTTAASTTYALSFSVGSSNAIAGCGLLCGDVIIDVATDGNVQTINVGKPLVANTWQDKTVYFTTSGVVTPLSLTFRGIKGDDCIGLDNISVTAVPEPGTMAMLFAGLAAVGSVVARKRKQIG